MFTKYQIENTFKSIKKNISFQYKQFFVYKKLVEDKVFIGFGSRDVCFQTLVYVNDH